MSRRRAIQSIRLVPWGFVCLLLISGCASFPRRQADSNSGKPATPEKRKEAVIENFEQRRDETQYEAALGRWSAGDVAGCEMLLVSLVERRADFRDARRLLADLCLDRGDHAAAESHLRVLLEQDADDAQTHHSLGLLLEETGRRDEALFHLNRAVALEPANELYLLSFQTARQIAPR